MLHDLFWCVTWLIHVWRASFIWAMTHSDKPWLIQMGHAHVDDIVGHFIYYMTHSYVTWLIHMSHDSFIRHVPHSSVTCICWALADWNDVLDRKASDIRITNTLQHAATRCNPLQHAAKHCNTLQHTATHCNTLQVMRRTRSMTKMLSNCWLKKPFCRYEPVHVRMHTYIHMMCVCRYVYEYVCIRVYVYRHKIQVNKNVKYKRPNEV